MQHACVLFLLLIASASTFGLPAQLQPKTDASAVALPPTESTVSATKDLLADVTMTKRPIQSDLHASKALSTQSNLATSLLSKFGLADSSAPQRRAGFTCAPNLGPFACAIEKATRVYTETVEEKDAAIQALCHTLGVAKQQIVESLEFHKAHDQARSDAQAAAQIAFDNATAASQLALRTHLATTTKLELALGDLTSQTQGANCPATAENKTDAPTVSPVNGTDPSEAPTEAPTDIACACNEDGYCANHGFPFVWCDIGTGDSCAAYNHTELNRSQCEEWGNRDQGPGFEGSELAGEPPETGCVQWKPLGKVEHHKVIAMKRGDTVQYGELEAVIYDISATANSQFTLVLALPPHGTKKRDVPIEDVEPIKSVQPADRVCPKGAYKCLCMTHMWTSPPEAPTPTEDPTAAPTEDPTEDPN